MLVDGLSTDATPRTARADGAEPRYAVVVLQFRRGKGDALMAGFEAAKGDIIVMMDADGSTDGAEIPRFVAALTTGADFAKGSRFASGGGSDDITRLQPRRATACSASRRATCSSAPSYTDLCYGYSAFWRDSLPYLHIDCDGFEVETVINVRAAKAGLSIVEVASYEHERLSGSSNLHAWRDGKRVIKTIFRERFSSLPEPGDKWRPAYDEVLRARHQAHDLGAGSFAAQEVRAS